METQFNALVASKVRGIAGERRCSQAEIGKIIGVSRLAVNRRCRGEVPFTVAEICELAAHFDVPVAYFFGEAPSTSLFKAG